MQKNKKDFFTIIDKYYQANKLDIDCVSNNCKIHNNKINNEHILEINIGSQPIFKGHYNILGVYDSVTFMWYWPYIFDYLDQSLCVSKSQIKELYKYIKDVKHINQQYLENIIFRTINDSSYMSSINNIVVVIKTLIYYFKLVDYLLVYYDENKIMKIYKEGDKARNIYVIGVKKILRIL